MRSMILEGRARTVTIYGAIPVELAGTSFLTAAWNAYFRHAERIHEELQASVKLRLEFNTMIAFKVPTDAKAKMSSSELERIYKRIIVWDGSESPLSREDTYQVDRGLVKYMTRVVETDVAMSQKLVSDLSKLPKEHWGRVFEFGPYTPLVRSFFKYLLCVSDDQEVRPTP